MHRGSSADFLETMLWRHRRTHAWSEQDQAPAWPSTVHALSHEGLLLFGLDAKGRLHWDGKPVEVRQRLDLTWWQKTGAVATAIAVILAGLNGLVQAVNTGTEYGCKRHWWTSICVEQAGARSG